MSSIASVRPLKNWAIASPARTCSPLASEPVIREDVRKELEGGFERLLRFGQVARVQITEPRAVVAIHSTFQAMG